MHEKSHLARTALKDWARDVGLRAFGALLLAASYGVALILHRQFATPHHGHATLADFVIAAIGFAALVSGLAFAFEGEGLFRLVPMPPRSFIN
ncbi:MAG: hypothetical protein ACOVKV_09945 [Novosphingobium sp.]